MFPKGKAEQVERRHGEGHSTGEYSDSSNFPAMGQASLRALRNTMVRNLAEELSVLNSKMSSNWDSGLH